MLLWFGVLAHAQVSMEAVTKVLVGDSPKIRLLSAGEGVLTGDVTCEGAPPVRIQRSLRAGDTVEVVIPGLSIGAHACQGTLRLEQPGRDPAELPLTLTVEVRAPLAFEVRADDWERTAHVLVVHPNRALRAATADAIGVGGAVIASGAADLSDPSQPRFAFATDEEILQLRVTAEDDAGVRALLELSPWFYAIPHEDVVFPSGSAQIPGAESAKLDRTWTEVTSVLKKYGSVVKIRLYVAGYTDTVGDARANDALSLGRARAIAQWFAGRGFPGEVWYQGFGEGVLAVPTPDETDAAPNRRALYLLAAEVPPPGPDLPRADWVRLR